MCCGRGQTRFVHVPSSNTTARSPAVPVQAAVLEDFPKLADSPPILVTDDVVFRWARNARIARLLPVMNDVRVLERKIQANSCKSCQKVAEIDRSAIHSAKIALAECSDEIAKLVKQAVGVLKYKVVYRQHSQLPQEVTR